jgi:hypothetical protein
MCNLLFLKRLSEPRLVQRRRRRFLTVFRGRCNFLRNRFSPTDDQKTIRMLQRPALNRLAPILLMGWISGCVTAPPVQEMSDARQAIMAAEAANAEEYAAATLADARRYLDMAEQLIEDEVYGAARTNAVRARNRATRALVIAQSAAESAAEADD